MELRLGISGSEMMEGLNSDDDEEWLRATSVPVDETPGKKRQRKVVTLDDILEADYKESVRKAKPRKRKDKSKAKSHLYSSSDDDSEEDLRAPQLLDELEKQVVSGAGVGDEVEPEWGLPVLVSAQREPPPSLVRRLDSVILKCVFSLVFFVHENC